MTSGSSSTGGRARPPAPHPATARPPPADGWFPGPGELRSPVLLRPRWARARAWARRRPRRFPRARTRCSSRCYGRCRNRRSWTGGLRAVSRRPRRRRPPGWSIRSGATCRARPPAHPAATRAPARGAAARAWARAAAEPSLVEPEGGPQASRPEPRAWGPGPRASASPAREPRSRHHPWAPLGRRGPGIPGSTSSASASSELRGSSAPPSCAGDSR